jgi:molybdopterin-guanine dinucleotide biosynthesis protein A
MADWFGKTMLQSLVEKAQQVSERVFIISNTTVPIQANAEIINDIHPGKGPLSALETALLHANTSHIMLVACDMPLITSGIMRYLIVRSMTNKADITAPITRNGPEPLCAIYNRSVLPTVRQLMEQNRLRIRNLFDELSVNPVEEQEIVHLTGNASPHIFFANANTPDELEKIKGYHSEFPAN